MPFVTIDGQALHYIDQGTGPAVLLAGSYLWDQSMWAPQIAALAQQYRVIALDLWGHGQSGPLPVGTVSLDDLARQALVLLDHLDIERVTLVGLSVGGMWGTRLALSAAHRINGLVLMDTYVGAEPEPTRQYYFSLLKQIEEAGVITPALLDIVVPIFFALVSTRNRRCIGTSVLRWLPCPPIACVKASCRWGALPLVVMTV